MAGAQLTHVLRHVRALVGAPAPSDRQLLERFALAHEQESFAEIVRRHGPLVWGVCRRVLRQEQDAEDAFQATFLVLARKAGSGGWRESVAGWLQEVARRTALKALTTAARRRKRERQVDTMRHEAVTMSDGPELREAIDAELVRLPDHYREALLLCYVEGMSNEEAARRLRCPTGTVKSRLARGRELLRGRLLSRGIALPVAALAALLAGHAAVPSHVLADATARGALGFALGSVVASASYRAAALATGVLRGMGAVHAKLLTVLAMGLTVLVAGAGALALPAAPPVAAEGGQSSPQSKPAPLAEMAAPAEPLPAGALARMGTAGFHPGSVVYSVALSPDGKMVAAGAYGEVVRAWETATGREVTALRLTGHHFRTCAAFSPDGKTLVTGDSAGKVRVRDVEGKKTTEFAGGSGLRALAFSPDGKTLGAAAQDGSVRLFDAVRYSERAACRGHEGEVNSVAYSADGKALASAAADGTVRIWDPATGEQRTKLTGHVGDVRCVAFSPDGKLAASAGADGTVRLWDAATGKPVRTLEGHTDRVEAVLFAADGKTLYSGGYDNLLRRWDVTTGRETVAFRRHQRGIMGLALSGDGKTLASGGWDGVVRLWAADDGRELNRVGGHQDSVAAVGLVPGGRELASVASDGTLRLWDAATGKELRRFTGHDAGAWTAAFSADGKLVALKKGAGTVALWDAATGKESQTFTLAARQVDCLAVSADGKRVAAGSHDPARPAEAGSVTVWDATTGKELCRCACPKGWPRCLDLSPDGKRVAGGGHDGTVRVWDAAGGEELFHIEDAHKKPLECVQFSPDGRLLVSAANEQVVRLWDAASGKEVRQLPGNGGGVHAVAFSEDGRTLAVAGWSPVIHLWEVTTGQRRGRVEGHQGALMALAFAPGGRTLISGGADTTVLVWDLTGRQAGGRLRPAELTDADLEAAWSDLAGEDAARAYHSVWTLAAAPGPVLPLLRGALKPVSAVDAARLRRLVVELDDDDFEVRERATKALESAGDQAEAELRKALDGKPSAELRQRADHLLGRLKPNADSAERRRAARALEALEDMGTAEARQLLEALAKGAPEARLTREAKAALERLGRR
jgi:RNA polymerase sigma factor (sigma-70 family)